MTGHVSSLASFPPASTFSASVPQQSSRVPPVFLCASCFPVVVTPEHTSSAENLPPPRAAWLTNKRCFALAPAHAAEVSGAHGSSALPEMFGEVTLLRVSFTAFRLCARGSL